MEPAPEAAARSAGVVDQLRRQCEWPARTGRGLISVMKIGNDVYVILVCVRLRRSHRIGDSLGGVSGHQFERAATDPVGDHLCVRARSVGRSDALRTCVRMRGGDKAMYCARAQIHGSRITEQRESPSCRPEDQGTDRPLALRGLLLHP